MKTGRFLSTMAITALLAACSNEDFLNEQAPVVVDGNRPTAKVALAFDEANTRLEYDKRGDGWQWYFADGDKIGALLMDTWDELADDILGTVFANNFRRRKNEIPRFPRGVEARRI